MLRITLRAHAVLAAAFLVSFPPEPARGEGGNLPLAGRLLFERQWEPNDSLSPNGDGLGPMYNATSCAACHRQGGLGGGGGNEHNVDLLTLVESQQDSTRTQRVLQSLHRGFENSTSLVVHKHSVSPEYAEFRENLLLATPPPTEIVAALGGFFRPNGLGLAGPLTKSMSRLKIEGTHSTRHLRVEKRDDLIQVVNVSLKWTQRNTPSLFGLGLLDSIPQVVREQIMKDQESHGGSIKGRMAGAFGWRGQTNTLKDFVLGACANELGLQTPGNSQPLSPMDRESRPAGSDMDEQTIQELVAFVAALPPPKRLEPQNQKEAWALVQGKDLFVKAECHVCHVPDLGIVPGHLVQGVYSDLLTHDMGESLSDPAVQVPYYGGSLGEIARRWKTPPLWGVRDTAPYLHDGRAETLHEAIRQHDGEARYSREVYVRLREQEQGNLLAFVNSLGAP